MNNTESYPISSGHGTVDIPWSEDVKQSLQDDQGIINKQTKEKHHHHQEQQPQEHVSATSFGHATKHSRSTRSVKRDLNNI